MIRNTSNLTRTDARPPVTARQCGLHRGRIAYLAPRELWGRSPNAERERRAQRVLPQRRQNLI